MAGNIPAVGGPRSNDQPVKLNTYNTNGKAEWHAFFLKTCRFQKEARLRSFCVRSARWASGVRADRDDYLYGTAMIH